jgi:hypothetical protein
MDASTCDWDLLESEMASAHADERVVVNRSSTSSSCRVLISRGLAGAK